MIGSGLSSVVLQAIAVEDLST